jgi:hypothetical protein
MRWEIERGVSGARLASLSLAEIEGERDLWGVSGAEGMTDGARDAEDAVRCRNCTGVGGARDQPNREVMMAVSEGSARVDAGDARSLADSSDASGGSGSRHGTEAIAEEIFLT